MIRFRDAVMWFIAGLLLGFASCSHFPIDSAMAAYDGGDPTVILSAPGTGAHKGYVFFQIREGGSPTDLITAVFPAVNCVRTHCIEYQLIRLDGSFGVGGGLAEGQTEVSIPVSDIVGSQGPISVTEDGEYQMAVKVYYLGNNGVEQKVEMKGFIRINVLKSNYRPVVCNDPLIAWQTPIASEGKTCRAQFTTGMRSVLCGSCEGA